MGAEGCEIAQVNLPPQFISFLAERWGISTFHPPQAQAIGPILEGRNSLIAIPTASGKSLLAYCAIINQLASSHSRSKAIYIVPLKALAMEKYDELKEIGDALGYEVGLGIGDMAGEAKNIESSQILVCTSEKLDSLMRNKPEIIADVTCIIADEFHLLNDATRGPTLEINLTRLKLLRPQAQVIALSATVGNCEDLATWLGAELIQSNWRPVQLEYATFHDFQVEPRKREGTTEGFEVNGLSLPRTLPGLKSHPVWSVVNDSLESSSQVLIFVGTRRSAQSEAKNLAKRTERWLKTQGEPERILALQQLSQEVKQLSQTSVGEQLAENIQHGVAFHHAGLTNQQRMIIESSFKSGLLCCIVATPTLAAGVNLPARRVLVRDLKRWDDGMNRPLPIMEVRQMLGRAGRPRYDDKGEAWIYCKSTDGWEEADGVAQRYFFSEVEPVVSKLASEPAMRAHLLAAIATGGIRHKGAIHRFFCSTFLGATIPRSQLIERIDDMIQWLVDERFIRKIGVDSEYLAQEDFDDNVEEAWDDELPIWATIASNETGVGFKTNESTYSKVTVHPRTQHVTFGFAKANEIQRRTPNQIQGGIDPIEMEYEATPLGERTTQLYLDPLSASMMRTGLRRAVRRSVRQEGELSDFSFLHMCVTTPDFTSLWAKSSDLEPNSSLWLKANMVENELLLDSGYIEAKLGDVKSAWLVEQWIDEQSLRDIENELDVSPGDVHHRVDLIGWLMAGARHILLADDVFSQEHLTIVAEIGKVLDHLSQRIKHGCRSDLLQLVNIRKVGRQRARQLAELGIRTPHDVLKMTKQQEQIILSKRGWGPLLLKNILEEINKLNTSKNNPQQENVRFDDVPLDGETEP